MDGLSSLVKPPTDDQNVTTPECRKKTKQSFFPFVLIDNIYTASQNEDGTTKEATPKFVMVFLKKDCCEYGKGNILKQIKVLGATNFPWQLDEALRRRLEKVCFFLLKNKTIFFNRCCLSQRIYIELPQKKDRRGI